MPEISQIRIGMLGYRFMGRAPFEDGYRAAVVCDAILKASEEKRQVPIEYES